MHHGRHLGDRVCIAWFGGCYELGGLLQFRRGCEPVDRRCLDHGWLYANGLEPVCLVRGSLACAACIIAGVLFMPLVVGVTQPLAPLQIAGSIVPALIGVVLALANVPDRIRTDYSSEEDD